VGIETEERRLLVPGPVARTLPAVVRHALARLPAERQSEFLEAYTRRTKSVLVAYLLWLFLGWHYAYLGRWGVQLLFWLTLGGLFLWWLVDLVRVPGMVARYNEDVAMAVMRDLAVISQIP
jgi:hypothetical protein